MKFRSKFDKEEIKKKLDEKMSGKSLPDPRSQFMKMWETFINGASWFLWITNARARIARLFEFKSQEPTGLFDRMK